MSVYSVRFIHNSHLTEMILMPVSLIHLGYCYDPLLFVLVLLHFSPSLILRIKIVWSLCSSSVARRMITFRPTHHLMTSWSHRAESGLALVSVWAQLLMKNADRFLLAPTAGSQAGRQAGRASWQWKRHPPTGHTTLSLAHKISSIGSIKLKLKTVHVGHDQTAVAVGSLQLLSPSQLLRALPSSSSSLGRARRAQN